MINLKYLDFHAIPTLNILQNSCMSIVIRYNIYLYRTYTFIYIQLRIHGIQI